MGAMKSWYMEMAESGSMGDEAHPEAWSDAPTLDDALSLDEEMAVDAEARELVRSMGETPDPEEVRAVFG